MKANQKIKSLRDNNDAQVNLGMVGALVALLLMIIVGILVYWETSDAIVLSSDTANTSRDNVNTMAGTVFGLLPIIALVAVASIIIAVIVGFGGNKGSM